jgi:hypothetical protein
LIRETLYTIPKATLIRVISLARQNIVYGSHTLASFEAETPPQAAKNNDKMKKEKK